MKFPDRRIAVYTGIVLYGLVFLVPFLGNVHLFDWDEINFAESAREMILSGDYVTVQINFEPFWEKPPLFIWLQVLSMKLFGINEFAARFPNAVCGVLSLLLLYKTGRKIYDEKFGVYWMLAYAGSVLPFFYFKSGIIDPWFNLFIFMSIIYFSYFLIAEANRKRNLILSAFLLGIAVLTKGPVAFLIFLLSFIVFLVFRRFRIKANIKDVLLFTIVSAVTGGFWFILQIINGNAHLIGEFIDYQLRLFSTQDAGHAGFFMYHFVILLIGVFPASLIALLSFRDHFDGPGLRKDFFLWMMILFWTVIILFSIVNTKIIHYSSLCYFPLTFLAALTIRKYENSEIRIPYWLKFLIGVFATLYGLVVAFIPMLDRFKYRFIEKPAAKRSLYSR
jgi:4-amino-4-deoxy-L-arabinose transferase-like glycosyltransferase